MENKNCSLCLFKSKAAKNLSDPELKQMGNSCAEVVFRKGDTIFKENALSSNIIYLQKGLVKLLIEGPHQTQILRLKKAPCYLGLPTTMGDKVNHYSAVAIEPTTACFIDINTFKNLLKINPDFSFEIITELCRNELEQFHRCVKLIQNQIYGRLANHLLNLSTEVYESTEFKLPLTRNEIADLVCTSRETVSRLLSDLSKEKIIQVDGKQVRILNQALLEKISDKG
ncbi:MAG: Crp/Fnr family transcriptional regulator [Bacteroidales bacterium]|nr:Crp/Fnr family transcriptional regulator [Bacteroidales bacterium]